MKKLLIPVGLAAFLAVGTSCNSNSGSDTASSDSSATSTNSTANSNSAGAGAATDTGANMGANTGANSSSADTSMAGDKGFVLDAASGGLMEVELGKMASTNATSPRVKEFGRMMVTDHTKANTELKGIASRKSITVPPTPAEKEQSHVNDMQGKKGADFDKAYVDMMVDDHKEDISKFQDEAKNGKDPDVKAFASKTLPVLQKHLSSIQAIQSGMKK